MNQKIEDKKGRGNNNDSSDVNSQQREREREREKLQSQQSQLQSEITQLEVNPTNPEQQILLESKKKKLAELETKQKQLDKSLPLTAQISNLQREIKNLEKKPTRNQTEQALLTSKKKELAELLAKQSNTAGTKPNDKTALAIGCGIVGVLALLLIFVLAKNRKKRNKKIW